MMNHTSSPHESLPHQAGPRTPMPLALLILAAVAASALAQNAASQAVAPKDGSTTSPKSASAPATRPAITIGYDTTRLTGPLRPDGTVDYLAAINQQYSKGVTHENNAAVLILEAIDPKDAYPNEQLRQQIMDQLKPAPQAKEKYFKPLDVSKGPMLSASLDSAVKKAWEKKDYPELAQWLAQNELPLAKFVEASKRPRYYMPLVTKKPEAPIVEAIAPVRVLEQAITALRVRANLAMSERMFADAWADLAAMYRLGALLTHCQTLLEQLAGIGLCGSACDSTCALMRSPGITADFARQVLQELQNFTPSPSIASAIEFERCIWLEAIACFAKDPSSLGLGLSAVDTGDSKRDAARRIRVDLVTKKPVEWDLVLRQCNDFYDRFVTPIAEVRPVELTKAFETLDKEQRRLVDVTEGRAPIASNDIRERSQYLSNVVIGFFVPTYMFRDLRKLEIRTLAKRQLAILATALSLHKLENGSYPAALEGLSPKYLKAVPMDPFSDKPFIYKRRGTDFTLYSVGANGKDDGGKNKDNGDESGDDLVVTSAETVPSSESPGPGGQVPMHP